MGKSLMLTKENKGVVNLTKISPKDNKDTGVILAENQLIRKKRNLETTQKDFLDFLIANKGLIHKSCIDNRIRYSTYRTWLKNPKFRLRFEEAQQVVNEQVEQSLINKFKGNSPVPEIFYLKSRDNRYKPIAILEGSEDKPIVVTHDSKTLEKVAKTIIDALKKE